jgi:hypothetical protein
MSRSYRSRSVSCQVELDVREEAELVWSVAVAHGPELASEHVSVTVDGKPAGVEELAVDDGARLHVCTARPGRLALSYGAEVSGLAPPSRVDPVYDIGYRRPSRYAESSSTTSAGPAAQPTARPRPCS